MTHDWRILIIIYIILSGIWGVLVKVAADRLNPYTMSFLALTSAWITVFIFAFPKLNLQPKSGVLIALLCGVIGGLTVLLFYSALKQAPANILIPLSTLYTVLTVILSYFFLQETLTIRHIAGIVFGILAIFLLAS